MKDRGNTRLWTYADSADPKSIDEIYDHGIKIRGAVKGPDSINFGIDILQQEPFKVTSRSLNLIKELREYCWDSDKEGRYINKPIGTFNHCIDAMRYLAMEEFSYRKPSTRKIRMTTFG